MAEKVRSMQHTAGLTGELFQSILEQVGHISRYDAIKVSNFFTHRGSLDIAMFEEFLRKSQQI